MKVAGVPGGRTGESCLQRRKGRVLVRAQLAQAATAELNQWDAVAAIGSRRSAGHGDPQPGESCIATCHRIAVRVVIL